MRALVIAATLLAFSSPLLAQQPAAAPPKLFVPAADIAAMIAKAKRDRRPDQPNFSQPIVGAAPYSANLEYRVAGLNAPASVHETEAEMFVVVEGSGTLVTGGTLKEERRTNPANLTGTGIENGKSQRVAKGDMIMVPAKTPHWFGEIDGALVLMSIHLPIPAGSTR